MVKMIGLRWGPNLPILSDFDCLQPRRRFLRYLFENHMDFGDYQDELAFSMPIFKSLSQIQTVLLAF